MWRRAISARRGWAPELLPPAEAALGSAYRAGAPARAIVIVSAHSALGHSRQAQAPIEMLALRKVYRVVARRPGAEPGDGEIGHQTLADRTDFGGLCEQPDKRQRSGQDKLGGPQFGLISTDLRRLSIP